MKANMTFELSDNFMQKSDEFLQKRSLNLYSKLKNDPAWRTKIVQTRAGFTQKIELVHLFTTIYLQELKLIACA